MPPRGEVDPSERTVNPMKVYEDILMQAALSEMPERPTSGAYSLDWLEQTAIRRLSRKQRG